MRLPIVCHRCGDETATWLALADHVRLLHPDETFDLAEAEIDASANVGT